MSGNGNFKRQRKNSLTERRMKSMRILTQARRQQTNIYPLTLAYKHGHRETVEKGNEKLSAGWHVCIIFVPAQARCSESAWVGVRRRVHARGREKRLK